MIPGKKTTINVAISLRRDEPYSMQVVLPKRTEILKPRPWNYVGNRPVDCSTTGPQQGLVSTERDGYCKNVWQQMSPSLAAAGCHSKYRLCCEATRSSCVHVQFARYVRFLKTASRGASCPRGTLLLRGSETWCWAAGCLHQGGSRLPQSKRA